MLSILALTQAISKHSNLHPSRQKTFASLIFGALCSNNVHQQSLSRYVSSPNPKAALRKVERFLAKKNYPQRTLLGLLPTSWVLKESLTCAWIGPNPGKKLLDILFTLFLSKDSSLFNSSWQNL